jgi:phage terminase large subunit-like protein
MENKLALRYIIGVDTCMLGDNVPTACVFNQTKETVIEFYQSHSIEVFEAEVLRLSAYYSAVVIREY